MREILFRGKPISNEHKWVYGDYCDLNKGRSVSSFKVFAGPFIGTPSTMYAVIPETVGQYTGLKDKNGTRIFEGDCFKTYCTGLPVYRHIVRYYPEHSAFMARCIERNIVHYLSDYSPSAIEVIGNIHDNPELLEREHNE